VMLLKKALVYGQIMNRERGYDGYLLVCSVAQVIHDDI